MTDHIEVAQALVRDLLAAQRPDWATLPLAAVPFAGTDNALFRLGEDKVVRLPRAVWAAEHAEKEHRWLPRLAPGLPLPIPEPLFLGEPGDGYPWRWTVCRWLPGEAGDDARLRIDEDAARRLGAFVRTLGEIDPADGPRAGRRNNYRGVPLAALDATVRKSLDQLHDRVDVPRATAAWESALRTPVWAEPPRWLHGDLHAANLVTTDGRLSAVIDFGLLGVGDPAADLAPAWSVFAGPARDAFRKAAASDPATWDRGRGWALYGALVALPFYWTRNPVIVARGLATIAEVFADP